MNFDDLLDDRSPLNDELVFSQPIRDFLQESARWGQLLAIVGFVFIGLGLLFPLILLMIGFSSLESVGLVGLFLPYLILAGIFIVPIYYLYQFSTKAQQALLNETQPVLEDAFANHRSMFKFYGIFIIIAIGIQLLGLLLLF